MVDDKALHDRVIDALNGLPVRPALLDDEGAGRGYELTHKDAADIARQLYAAGVLTIGSKSLSNELLNAMHWQWAAVRCLRRGFPGLPFPSRRGDTEAEIMCLRLRDAAKAEVCRLLGIDDE